MKYDKSDQKKIFLFLFAIGIICVILVLQQKKMARNPPISVYLGNVPDNDAVYKRYPKRVPSWKKKEIGEPVSTEPGVARTEPGARPAPEITSQKKSWWKFW